MNRRKIRIRKASGLPQSFSKQKLFRSLQRTGLPHHECKKISEKVEKEITEGTNTKEIYQKTLKLVKQQSPLASVHYSLKKSLFELGPEGHLFEIFVARYFKEIGYSVSLCHTLQGFLVKHEVDVIAKKNGEDYFSECKFHNHSGVKNDIKVALYVKSRWDDLRKGPDGKNLKGYFIVSNTSFTSDAIVYGNGTGLSLLGVNMPENDSFLDKIKELKLYPLTSLRHLPRWMKKELLAREIVLARDVLVSSSHLRDMGMSEDQLTLLKEEIETLNARPSWK
jgi:hypothetical protein